MRLPEQRLWDRMRHNLKGSGIWLERVENSAANGHPDVEATWHNVHTVVELKMVAGFPARPMTPVLGNQKGLNKYQLNWWLEANKFNRRGIIVVGVGLLTLAIDGKHSETINQMNKNMLLHYAFAKDWTGIENHLRGIE